VIAGRPDNPDVESEVREIIRKSKMSDAVRVLTDVPLETLENEISSCDVAICLRWPTAGEVSAVLMRALGAGKPVIVSDVPQYADLDPTFCWKVPTAPAKETSELERLMLEVMQDPEAARNAGAAAVRFVATEATVAVAAQSYLEVIEQCRQLRAEQASGSRQVTSARTGVPGVNVISDWQSTTGLAEAARRSVGAMIDARVDVAAQEVEESWAPHDPRRAPEWLHDLPKGRPHEIDICYLNVNELHVMSDDQLRPRGADNYLIGYWFWELPVVSKAFVDQIKRVDEIWVGSRFTREAFVGHTDKPVHVMPCVVSPQRSAPATRKDLALPEDACLFVFHFDAHSTFARKNPWAVISAFARAFSAAERSGPVRLVLKTINLSRCPPAAAERLMHEMRQVGGVLLDMELSRDEMASLIARSDVYVSLHRSEGFGLGIAEAMLAGRPAIATAYSGNLDFMTYQNSCLVGYRLVPVTTSEIQFNPGMEIVYEPDQLWAEANLDQAARWMRTLYEDKGLRERIGAAGSATIETRYNSAAAGAVAAARLADIASERAASGKSLNSA
jgi:glycosyltransferase involved in cell wall biosynthesis